MASAQQRKGEDSGLTSKKGFSKNGACTRVSGMRVLALLIDVSRDRSLATFPAAAAFPKLGTRKVTGRARADQAEGETAPRLFLPTGIRHLMTPPPSFPLRGAGLPEGASTEASAAAGGAPWPLHPCTAVRVWGDVLRTASKRPRTRSLQGPRLALLLRHAAGRASFSSQAGQARSQHLLAASFSPPGPSICPRFGPQVPLRWDHLYP